MYIQIASNTIYRSVGNNLSCWFAAVRGQAIASTMVYGRTAEYGYVYALYVALHWGVAYTEGSVLNGSIERHTYSLSDGYLVSMRAMYVHQHDVVQFPTQRCLR